MTGKLLLTLALAAALPAALTAAAARAEGARIVLDCTHNATGAADSFTIAPVQTDATGKGRITVSRGGETFDGVAASSTGPFQFTAHGEHFALLFNGALDDGRLSVTLHHATAWSSTLTTMTCETDF